MTKKCMVEVTNADIESGKRGSASSCPVALALKRALHDKSIYVTGGQFVRELPRFFSHKIEKGLQALAKGAMTAHDCVESSLRAYKIPLPQPGVPSGEILEWKDAPPFA